MTKTINLPPFPPLTQDHGFWTGEIVLSAWQPLNRGLLGGYQIQPNRSVTLLVKTPDLLEAPPNEAQAAAYKYLLAHWELIHVEVLKGILSAYPALRQLYIDAEYGDDTELADKKMPRINDIEQLKTLIELSGICIREINKEGVAYTGFEFECTWEEEHGLGVVVYKERVLDVESSADIAVWGIVSEADPE